jgi:hypothetical protein
MRQVLPVVGAAIGAYFGGAQGAQIGWTIGSIVGNAVDPQVIKGPSIGDLAAQTSQEGVPRPIFFALSQPVSGNIVMCSKPNIVTKRQRQGKGGPVTETQAVYRSYAVAIGEGPNVQLIRCWSNGKLVYDARPGQPDPGNAKFFQGATFHSGDFDQMPDSHMQAVFGAANTPAMRGTAYIAWHDIDLTNQGGAVPQYVFQVMRCEGQLLTSRPYAVEAEDEANNGMALFRFHHQDQPQIQQDNVQTNMSVISITRFGSSTTYNAPNVDKVNATMSMLSITRFGDEVNYTAPNTDKIQVSMQMLSITRFGSEVSYASPYEGLSNNMTVLSITRS